MPIFASVRPCCPCWTSKLQGYCFLCTYGNGRTAPLFMG